MKALGASIALLAIASACIHRSARTGPEERLASASVTIDVSERHQTLEGFGASIAFYIDLPVKSPGPPGLYQVLFPDLGLDILRLRNRYQRSESGDGDVGQEVEILSRATDALGHRPKILLSSWSPPAALKATGAERCRNNDDCTLRKDAGGFVYAQFGDYWRDALAYYAGLGIVPDYVTIQNEPDFIPPDWEGCKFEPSETARYPGYDRALAAVRERVAGLPSPPKLLGPEVVGVHGGKVRRYLQSVDLDLLYGIAHHLYEKGDDGIWDWRNPGPDSFVAPMRDAAAAAPGKPLFQTEFGTDDDHGVDGGFETALLIHHSLVEEGVVAFLYWDLVWKPEGGLVSVDGRRYTIRDQYYALKHYARFTDPGYVRVGARSDAGDVRVSAFLSPAGERLSVVVLNAGGSGVDVRLDTGGFAAAKSALYRTVFRPGASERWLYLGALPASRAVRLPARSVATAVFGE